MVQRSGALGFAAEPFLECRVLGKVWSQNLDSDPSAEAQIAPLVHFGHSATTDDLADLVAVAEHLAGLSLRHENPFPTCLPTYRAGLLLSQEWMRRPGRRMNFP